MAKKEYSDLKITWFPEKLKSLFKSEVTAPIHIRIKPTNKCVHNCFYCVYNPKFSSIHTEVDRISEIPRYKMLEVLSDIKEMGVKAITFSGGGEPLAYPYIEEVLEKVREYEIDYAMITNAQLLSGRKAELLRDAKWIRVSADYCNPEIFEEIRETPANKFFEVSENLRNFAKLKNPKCVFGINFVVHEKNKDKIYESAKFFKELGLDYVRFSPVWNPDFLKYHEPFKERVIEQIKKAKEELEDNQFKVLDTFKKDFEFSNLSERTYSKCYFMQINPVIAADQIVYFCHNKAYDKSGILGSIKDKSFKEIWFSKEAADKFKTFDCKEGCKHQCSNDPKNILIGDILESMGEHINFI